VGFCSVALALVDGAAGALTDAVAAATTCTGEPGRAAGPGWADDRHQ
jgi:hypothetical protein